MSVNGMTIIDLDSHLVGDLQNWDRHIEEKWKPFLPKSLPTQPDERRRTLIGNRINDWLELTRQNSEKPKWCRPEDLTPQGRVRNLDKDGIDICRSVSKLPGPRRVVVSG